MARKNTSTTRSPNNKHTELLKDYPYIKQSTYMIYTIGEYVERGLFVANNAGLLDIVGKKMQRINKSVSSRIKKIRTNADNQIKEIIKFLGLRRVSNPKDFETAVNNYYATQMSKINVDPQKIAHQVLQRYLTNGGVDKPGLESRIEELLGNLNKINESVKGLRQAHYVQPAHLRKILRSAESKNKKINNTLGEQALQTISNDFAEAYAQELTDQCVSLEKVDSSEVEEWISKAVEKSSDTINANLGLLTGENLNIINNQIKLFKEETSTALFDQFKHSLDPIVELIEENVIPIDNTLVQKTLQRAENKKQSIVYGIGWLYELIALTKLYCVTLDFGDKADVRYVPLPEQDYVTSDVQIIFHDDKKKTLKIGISEKSNEKAFGQDKKTEIHNLPSVISTEVNNLLRRKSVRWLILNCFSLMINKGKGKNGKQQGITFKQGYKMFDVVGRLRYQYGRLMAINTIFGRIFSAAGLSYNQNDFSFISKNISMIPKLPLFIETPEGLILTTHVLDDMLSTLGVNTTGEDDEYKKLYKNDKKLMESIQQYYGSMSELSQYNYSFFALSLAAEGKDVFEEVHPVSFRGDRYFYEEVNKAYNIMSSIDSSTDTMMQVIISGVDVYAKNSYRQLLHKK